MLKGRAERGEPLPQSRRESNLDDLPQSLRAHFERQAERNNQEGAPGGYLGLKDPRKSFVAFMATRFEASNPKGEILPELGQDEEGVGKKVLKSINYDRASAEVKAGLDKSREAERGKYETFNAAESPSVFITDAEPGCFADIGMMTQFLGGSQKLNLPHTCSLGTVVHELLHALGMGHEQARPDRDDYVTVHWQNIKSGMASQFDKKPNADTARPYDVGSIMHYSGLSFSNGRGPSMTPTRRGQSDLYASGLMALGQREGISRLDWEQLVHLYNCRQDERGRYSECSPEAGGPDLLIILLGVFGGVAACGCIGFAAYWFRCRGKKQRKIARQEVRPLMPARR
eukprot:symbB.v1.2.036101.t1/scaffold5010.1/size60825/3